MCEMIEGLAADRFGTVEGCSPTTQIQSCKSFRVDLAGTKFVSKIRSGRKCAAIMMNRPKPAFWPVEKIKR